MAGQFTNFGWETPRLKLPICNSSSARKNRRSSPSNYSRVIVYSFFDLERKLIPSLRSNRTFLLCHHPLILHITSEQSCQSWRTCSSTQRWEISFPNQGKASTNFLVSNMPRSRIDSRLLRCTRVYLQTFWTQRSTGMFLKKII